MIRFRLARVLPSLNVTQRQHWSVRLGHIRALAWEVRVALDGPPPPKPFARARVTVERVAPRSLDRDNAVGSCKPLLDVLKAQGEPFVVRSGPKKGETRVPNPVGLGLVAGDEADRLELVVTQRRGAPHQRETLVTVEELPA